MSEDAVQAQCALLCSSTGSNQASRTGSAAVAFVDGEPNNLDGTTQSAPGGIKWGQDEVKKFKRIRCSCLP